MSSVVQFQRKESQTPGPESPAREAEPRVMASDLPHAERGATEDRRGPFRPQALIPTRARLQGRVVARMFQAGDVIMLVATGVIAHTIGAVGVAGLSAACAGALTVLLSLSIFRAYGFNRREELAFHLTRVTGAFAVGAGAAFALLLPFVPMAALGHAMASWAPAD